ncbi:MAG: membrane protein insertase YidC [Xanthobacteraceae bacterium]
MNEHKNTILAIVLSLIVVVGWEYFFAKPEMENQAQQHHTQIIQHQPGSATPANRGTSETSSAASSRTPGGPSAMTPTTPSVPSEQPKQVTREAAIAASRRVAIDTPRLSGSINLHGALIDDLSLKNYHVTTNPSSPRAELLSPLGAPHPFYAEFGWVGASGAKEKLPDQDTDWKQVGTGALSVGRPVTLRYDNGQGLIFARTISVDDHYMFHITESVQNKSGDPVTLFPYGLISRHGTPKSHGYSFYLHEGPVGYIGKAGLQQPTYKKILDAKATSSSACTAKHYCWNATNAWLGITDEYWAAALVPNTDANVTARFSVDTTNEQEPIYQSDYLQRTPQTVVPGTTATVSERLFAGAKEVSVVGINFPFGPGGYNQSLHLNHFDLLIDWGWIYFISKPMFLALDFFFHLIGNFGIAILIVTVSIKILFFPLANKSYASMAKMKALQPQMAMIKERYADDRTKQQQATMELYKKEQINPVAGCLPMIIQIPVFFALYDVLYTTIEMRHAPFYGWIHDLSAPDPTNIFTLFGLFPWHPAALLGAYIGGFLHIGAWPAIMGVTMWFQMKLNPTPPDPTQQMIFNWMPLIFTFMLAHFPAGLVIYWAWNNSLSVVQQSVIMHRNGAKIQLWDNMKAVFIRSKPKQPAE